ncbi:MAG: glycosyltransferase family 4 protein [Bacteroidota bacterium]|nr:glycosyltransferase family 4 protein [Bacteroidota bacterium]
MNIVLVTYEFPPLTATGGIGSYMYHLSVFLSAKGHNVTVFSANPVTEKLIVEEQFYCTNYQVPAVDNDTFRTKVLPVFERFVLLNEVDVIESPEVGACALYIKKKFPQIPLIVKMHTPGVLITRVSNTYLSLVQKLRFSLGALLHGRLDAGHWSNYDKNRDVDAEYQICMKADTLLSPSLALKKWAVRFWGVRPGRIQILQNPFSIQDDLFLLPLTNRPPVISFVGKLSVLKGMKALTKAIPEILEKNKGYKIFLVGRDEFENGKSMKKYMEDELAAYNSSIVFTGALTKGELKEIYGQSRLCIFPSLWENFPTVILEAMAAGAAIAASNVGGIPEIISEDLTGLLFNAKRPKQIARTVNRLLENEDKRIEIVKAARNDLKNKMNDVLFENNLLRVFTKYERLTG